MWVTEVTAAWVLRGEPVPVRLMNTIWADTSGVHDDLTTPAALRDWVALVHDQDADALDSPGLDELAEARALRDSLRRLAAFSTDDPFDPRRAEARSSIPVWVWVMSLFIVAWAVWYAARMWDVPASYAHSPTYSHEAAPATKGK